MSTEAEVGVFLDSVLNYFTTTVQQAAVCGTPFLAMDKTPELSDFTGTIKISGKYDGVVAFTAPKGMLCVMLMRMQETDMCQENICDLVGEIANTLSGNARRDFGHQFNISVPAVTIGRKNRLELPAGARPIVIPIAWRNYSSSLVVYLQ
ncbi:MAG TPA: chemotaxis protein CheX [Steroidobacteraceae bacterium]|nr:chemotaxis protein CheX [Steroidobacteraceae bacterium]